MHKTYRAGGRLIHGAASALCHRPPSFFRSLPPLGGKWGSGLQSERGFASKLENRQALGLDQPELNVKTTAMKRAAAVIQPQSKMYTDQMMKALEEKSWTRALEVFQSAEEPDTILYSTIIHIASQLGHYEEGMELFNEMKAPRNEATYSSVFKILRGLRDVEKAKIMYQEMLSKLPDAKTHPVTLITYLDCLATSGSVQEVAAEMNAARERGMKLAAPHFGVLLKLLRDLALPEKSFQVLVAMPKQNVRPTLVSYTTVLDTCTAEMTKRRDFSKAVEYHSRVRAHMAEQGIRKEDEFFKTAERKILKHTQAKPSKSADGSLV
eukprot:TRINITY_DN4048_c0_g1_i2.p1 TRINITY_DN4048_c0_g1~~TRINITY_DN4048_c0_g1_i2.p1  ORF type:complete len:323 (+),score=50.62 TRINITY_DN4048_c0_g1_i2:160-1128(+)